MHAIQIVELFVVGAILSTALRFMHHSLCAAEEGFASLFVMVDRTTLGWPRGVQESDEPWGWHEGLLPPPERPGGPDDDGPDAGSGARWLLTQPVPGGLVVPVDRVRPVHLGVRPH